MLLLCDGLKYKFFKFNKDNFIQFKTNTFPEQSGWLGTFIILSFWTKKWQGKKPKKKVAGEFSVYSSKQAPWDASQDQRHPEDMNAFSSNLNKILFK